MKFPFLSMLALASCLSTASAQWLKDADIPSTGEDWISLASDGSQFQPSPKHRHLFSGGGSSEAFIYASPDVAYDTYAQAWRFLGYYIDCSEEEDDDRRELKNDDDGVNPNANCQRHIMWAAYVDPGYQGGGFGEYSFYDVEYGTWASSCDRVNDRCVKHDCHLEDTSFELLGFFKEPANNDEFWEQLFKHEGVCVWPDEIYPFAQAFREKVLPQGCTQLYSGNYYDIKPLSNGQFGIGIYTDAYCMEEYNDGEYSINDELYNTLGQFQADDNAVSFDEYSDDLFAYWNQALEYWRICQPCRAYHYRAPSFVNYGYYDNCDENGNCRRRAQDEDDYDYEWTCDDDAGYHNVNQCMKFTTHTRMETASVHEVRKAAQQGTLVGVSEVKKATFRETTTKWARFIFFALSMVLSTILVFHLRGKVQAMQESPLATPLV